MHQQSIRRAASLIACGLVAACQSLLSSPPPINEPALAEPALPQGYKKTPPASAESTREILMQTATVFRGRISSVKFTFDDCSGPRTNYVFSDAKSLIGTEIPAQVTVSVFGGPTPRGTWMRATEITRLALNSEYTVFLRNTDWTFSPVVRNLAFRSERIGGRDVLIDPDGHLVTGWGEDGPLLSEASVTEAVGHRASGYRDAEAGTRKDSAIVAADAEALPVLRRGPGGADAATRRQPDATSDRSLTKEELSKARLFERPQLASNSATATARDAISPEGLISAVRKEAERHDLKIGGKVVLNPYWRCWSSTPTVNASRPQ
jgi:hypothetical protein